MAKAPKKQTTHGGHRDNAGRKVDPEKGKSIVKGARLYEMQWQYLEQELKFKNPTDALKSLLPDNLKY